MQRFKQPEDTLIFKLTDTFDFIAYTIGFHFVTIFQSAFMFVSALQANEMVSGAIKGDMSSQEALFRFIAILTLFPVTIMIGAFKHCLVSSYKTQIQKKELPSTARDTIIGEYTHLFKHG
jgi:hypothetical protein